MTKLSDHTDEKAPLFKSWNTWYLLVILNLILLIIIFGLIMEYFT
jgi:hypothetical protein